MSMKEKCIPNVNHLIILVGLPGTGKSTISTYLAREIQYHHIESNAVRRACKTPETKELQRAADRHILEKINSMTSQYLSEGKGVILDSLHRYAYRRGELYSLASAEQKPVLVLECICAENTSKHRMTLRPESDGTISDPKDTSIYDRFVREWESLDDDFDRLVIPHVSYLQYNSETCDVSPRVTREPSANFIKDIRNVLTQFRPSKNPVSLSAQPQS